MNDEAIAGRVGVLVQSKVRFLQFLERRHDGSVPRQSLLHLKPVASLGKLAAVEAIGRLGAPGSRDILEGVLASTDEDIVKDTAREFL